MATITCKGAKVLEGGFTGERKRAGLVYDFSKDGGAYSGNTYVLGTMEGSVLIEKVFVRATTSVTSAGAATISVGHTDSATAFVSAEAKGDLEAGEVATIEATAVPMVLADGKQIVMTIGTADLTAGVLVVEVVYKDARAA
jgi:hypothetical protein